MHLLLCVRLYSGPEHATVFPDNLSLISLTAIFHSVKLLITTGIILFVLAIREMKQTKKHMSVICFFPISPWRIGCCITISRGNYKVLQVAVCL